MKFNYLLVLASALILSAGCASEVAEAPAGETASPPPTAASVPADTMSPESAPASGSAASRSGTFVAAEVETEGTAAIVTEAGQNYLELDQSFQTSDRGPDLVVILHRSDDVLGATEPPAYPLQEQDYVVLAPLEAFSGAQRYLIPAEVNLDDYKSAAIWCRQFNATFGVAKFDS
ncbi:MAG: DM13 domain-containing protein [Leptolyngbyaceae cyanobacterium SM1_1_3]|nr:DM13 domain-containing protein [Leptolyngbyaceae cyanobacterium SM1_1_3]NJN00980.1 DM13 domain-containing protein [Leptolyngbyaceae cyanobacterium RM1_1_2]NJO11476.1 DM13 domain-containing protein [Leptolyngbyaceae cyanobacterium SL_1_1]